MREIFAPSDTPPPDPGRVFYTIRPEDVHKSVLPTTIGNINVIEFMGRVLKIDVGKRIYRVPNNEGNYWFWQMENQQQFERRIAARSCERKE